MTEEEEEEEEEEDEEEEEVATEGMIEEIDTDDLSGSTWMTVEVR